MVYDVTLTNYRAKASKTLSFGTFDSYGNEQLQITQGDGWDGLAVVVTFNGPNGSSTNVRVGSDGLIDVPAEATADKNGRGEIVFVGTSKGLRRISATLAYTVITHGSVNGLTAVTPTQTLVEQILTAAKNAEDSTGSAEQSAKSAQESAETAEEAATDAKETADKLLQSTLVPLTNTEIEAIVTK